MSSPASLVLVINCGSSSLKFALFDGAQTAPLLSGLAERLGQGDASIRFDDQGQARQQVALMASCGQTDHAAALSALLAKLAERGWIERVMAVGHRVVHGGERFTAATLIGAEVLADIEACAVLAPLHNPANLLGIRAAMKALPAVPQVAVFDTAFHQTMPRAAYLYALPRRYQRTLGVRRYGFHGTSHAYVARQAVQWLGLNPADHGLVTAHLGNGASATAVLNGCSVDTTMGMTPLEGLVMGTRCGDVDAGALIYLARREGLDVDGLDAVLNKQSGLLGLSELSNDCRTLEQAAAQGHEGACDALAVFAHRLARLIGGLVTSLPRLDAIVFTGGIGENAAALRADTLARLAVFGVALDADANRAIVGGRSGVISAAGTAGPRAVVIPTHEEWVIANETRALAGLSTVV